MHFLCLTLTEIENLIFLPYMERCEIPKLTFHKYLIQSNPYLFNYCLQCCTHESRPVHKNNHGIVFIIADANNYTLLNVLYSVDYPKCVYFEKNDKINLSQI